MSHHKINTSLLILKECPYTASSRDALENTLPEAREISQGRGFCTPRGGRGDDGAEVGVGVGADLTSTDRVAMLAQNLTCYNMNEISNKQCNGHKQMIISVGIIMISSNIFS